MEDEVGLEDEVVLSEGDREDASSITPEGSGVLNDDVDELDDDWSAIIFSSVSDKPSLSSSTNTSCWVGVTTSVAMVTFSYS